MATLQEIEFALQSINDTAFQELCDDYLFWSEDNYPDINRPGTQKGKKKSKKGTPDSFWLLPSGKYAFAEHTTKNRSDSKTAFFKKLKDDLLKCLDTSVTGVEPAQIHKIILCFNSEIQTKEIEALRKLINKHRIALIFKSIDTLALDIYGRYQHLAAKHLHLHIDSGQILPPKLFAEEYSMGGGGLSTPLDNQFYFREEELINIAASLAESNIVALSGPPGVGKSKLALAALDDWLAKNKSYEGYCISNKNGVPIFDDLKSYIRDNRDYMLFIDDANRQTSNLQQILSLLRSKRSGKLKVVITVRDYALEYIKSKCLFFNPSVIPISGLSDSQIEIILKSADFNITSRLYLKRILEIAKGSPRVAIMAGKLAIKHQSLEALHDLDDFYESYFHSFIQDEALFDNLLLQKTLGIISFFYSVDRSNRDFYQKMLSNFELTHQQFTEATATLEKLELLESSADNSIIRISDQVLSTFFFYKAFIKDKTLDFRILTFNYFESRPNRFSDTIIPANNDFHYEKVLSRIIDTLTDYFNSINKDEQKAFQFLDIFWFYKPDETLLFIYEKFRNLPVERDPVFKIDQKKNQINWDIDRYLKLLFKFFYQSTDNAISALEIAFEYVRRNASLYQDLFRELDGAFKFSHEDERLNFYRQSEFITLLIKNGNKDNPVYLHMFFDLFPGLLKTVFDIHGGSRRKMEIFFYYYHLPANNPVVKRLRKKIWAHFDKVYSINPAVADEGFYGYLKPTMDNVPEVLQHDLPNVLGIINKYFNATKFLHCYFVQQFINRYNKLGISHSSFPELKDRFYSKEYMWYKLLDGDRLRDREQHEYESLDFDKFNRIKEIELRYKFQFNDISEFRIFYRAFVTIITSPHIQVWSLHNSLDTILHETYSRNKRLGMACLKEIKQERNTAGYVPYKLMEAVNAAGVNEINLLFRIIADPKGTSESYSWMLRFACAISRGFLTKDHYELLMGTYRTLNQFYYFDFDFLDKFLCFNPRIYFDVLQLFCEKLEAQINVKLDHHFFEKHLHHFAGDLSLPKRAYYACGKAEGNFDHDCKDLLAILKLDRKFLLEYLTFISKDKFSLSSKEYRKLSIIWQLPDAEKLLKQAMDFAARMKFYYIDEQFVNAFFTNLREDNRNRSMAFLKSYLKKNCRSVVKVNMVLDIFRHSFNAEYPNAVGEYLALNDNVDDFKKIKLLKSFFCKQRSRDLGGSEGCPA